MRITVQDIVIAAGGTLVSGDKEAVVTSASTNSREIEPGALFVPVIGERVDAHCFIPQVIEKGAKAAFISHDIKAEWKSEDGTFACIRVEDTVRALQKLAAWYRNRFFVPVIGITGSVGKTTTKEMIAAALETEKNILKTKGNQNSQIGVAMMMLCLEKEHELAVIEMGMSEPGEMMRLAGIARPETAVMTNIGVSHIGQLGSKENIRKEKMNIINEMPERGNLYYNGDDELLSQIPGLGQERKEDLLDEETRKKLPSVSLHAFGMGEDCEFRAKDIVIEQGTTSFVCVYPEGNVRVSLAVPGRHNVGNALVALAIAHQYGVDMERAAEGLAGYRPPDMRGQVIRLGETILIDDTYNASPDSMKSAVEVLLSTEPASEHIVVFGDVLELGRVSESCHEEVGVYLANASFHGNKVTELVTLGEQAKYIAKGAMKTAPSLPVHSFDTREEVTGYLKKRLKKDTAVVLKGSRGMHMDEIVKELTACLQK